MAEKKSFNFKLLGLLLLNFAILYFIYQIFLYYQLMIGMWLYLIAGCGLFVAYFFLNRGFSNKPTPNDELPDDWSAVEKCEYLRREAERKKTARRLMLFLVPIILVFMIDLLILFLPDLLETLYPS